MKNNFNRWCDLMITTALVCLVIIGIEYLVYESYTTTTVRALEQGVLGYFIAERYYSKKGE